MAETTESDRRRRLLWFSIAVNCGLLGLFKYWEFALSGVAAIVTALGLPFDAPSHTVALPPGLSYFTFTSIAYVVDVYHRRLPASRTFVQHALFISFFPKLLAGPIVRAGHLLPQLDRRISAKLADIEVGLTYVLVGAVKKLVVSDQIAGHVNLVFESPTAYDRFTLIQVLLGYAIQIYCDFAAYSDLAVGFARILGIRLPTNFHFPYASESISEFWRRWHVTLSEWFRDYVFLPLEMTFRGWRSPHIRTTLNLFLTMLLCGLWHGAGWGFLLWGAIHGTALAVHALWLRSWFLPASARRRIEGTIIWAGISRALTLGVVLIAWIFFRTESVGSGVVYLTRVVGTETEGIRLVSPHILAAVAGVTVLHLIWSKDSDWPEGFYQRSAGVRILAYSALLGLLVFLGATESVPFIYFQF